MKYKILSIALFLWGTFFALANDMDLKELLAKHYKDIVYFSNETIDFKTKEFLEKIKGNVFCDLIEDGDEKEILKREDLNIEKYYFQIERISKSEKGIVKHKSSDASLHSRYLRDESKDVPDLSFNKVIHLTKKAFHNCEEKELDKIHLMEKGCMIFDLEYFIFFDEKNKLEDHKKLCFKIFSMYDEQEKSAPSTAKRRVKVYSILH